MKILITSLVIVLVGIFGVYQANASGISIDWTGDDLIKKEAVFTDDMNGTFGICRNVDSIDIVSDLEYMNGATLKSRGCVVEGKDVDMYVSSSVDIDSDNPRNFAIRIKPSGKFYFLKPGAIANAQYANLISETNMYIEWRNTYYERKLVRAMDIRSAIRADRFDSTGNPIRYTFDDSSASVDTYAFTNIDQTISAGPITKDGKFVFWSGYGWLYKMDIEVGVLDIKYMPGWDVNWQNTPYYSNQIYPVDSEGRYVYLGGKLDMLIDTVNCGQYYTIIDHMGVPEPMLADQTNCHMRSFKGMIGITVNGGQGVFGARIEGSKLLFGAYDFRGSSANPRILAEFSPEGVSDDSTRLDYLALGDSFSSGEGDLGKRSNGHSYYREGTDTKGDKDKGIPRELCHISQRSYPYLLASGMELSGVYADNSEKWTSVACSGATIADMNKSLSNDYVGQDEGSIPRLEGYDRTTLKQQALQYMIPGRQKQVEFVKKYRPNVVTITAGGNDIHFAKIIKACVSPNILDGGEWTSRCSYAKDDAKKANIAFAIMDLQEELVNLYKELKDAGDKNTQLYVLGYPIFVDDKAQSLKCGLNVRLDSAEREMIAESTKFLNQIIRLAASEAGAMYINTENSLGNHKLCGSDSKKAANGITGLWDNAESFHPNHYGHELMANTVWNAMDNESLLGHVCKNSALMRCPSNQHGTPYIPEYFREAIARQVRAKVLQSQGSVPDILQKGLSIPLTILDYTFGSNQISFILLYSERTELGSFTTNNNGGYTGVIQLPSDISPGYHTLEIESVNQNGEPIKLWKIVEIRSEDPDDWDGDGIPNDTDRCLYIQPVGIDEDGDGIDDGCDPEIGSPVDTLKQAIASNRSTYTASKIDENTKRAVLNERPIIDWQGTDQDPNLYESESGTSLHNSDRVGIISIFALGAILVLGISLWIKITQRKK